MHGTEKQIKWAEKIKSGRMNDLEQLENLVAAISSTHPAKLALSEIRAHYTSTDAGNAGWWIALNQGVINTQGVANDIAKGRKIAWPTETNMGWE